MSPHPALEPCPFCGGPGKIYEDLQKSTDVKEPVKVWRVMCGGRVDCALLMSHFKTEQEAAAAWNTRAVDRTLNLFGEETPS